MHRTIRTMRPAAGRQAHAAIPVIVAGPYCDIETRQVFYPAADPAGRSARSARS
mgnify:CR=1 FL=1